MLLEKLSNASGPSGYEGEVRKIIIEEIKRYVDDIIIDRMGNIIVHKIGKGTKVMINAHIDEVGFIITGFNEDGTLKFRPLGDINSKIPPCKALLVGDKKIQGVVGLKPIHLQSRVDRQKGINYNGLCIDIGAKNRSDSEKYVEIGDFAVFNTHFDSFGDGLVKGKALDGRIGCYILIELLKENYTFDLYGVFSSMKEVGRRGAYGAAFRINPDLGITIDGVESSNILSVPNHLKGGAMGEGPIINRLDSSTLYDHSIINEIGKIAKENDIPLQIKALGIKENDGGSIQGVKEGCKVVSIGIPIRYINSSVSTASIKDIDNGKDILTKFLNGIN